MTVKINTPLTHEKAKELRAGDSCLITGVIYAARDAAHKRLVELIKNGKELPFDIKDSIIYFVGPTPAKPGRVIGSAGPTTSYRMDAYSPALIELGLVGMIGKGQRSPDVTDAIKTHGAVYFGAIGGCGALLGMCIKKSETVAYEDLGAEALLRLEVENFPAVVVIDTLGNNLYDIGRQDYLKSIQE